MKPYVTGKHFKIYRLYRKHCSRNFTYYNYAKIFYVSLPPFEYLGGYRRVVMNNGSVFSFVSPYHKSSLIIQVTAT